jgi:guanosine-3',5'-bis(diphosphate) 3'-pyrophosphohydrolase
MSTLEKAIQLSAKAHEGQVDKAGQPYIIHPIRVMLRVEDDSERIAAILHDIVEDTDITLDNLTSAGFSKEIVEAVKALTKLEGETRMEAAKRASDDYYDYLY